MIKKINIRELRPGMFISDINVPWLHHPFLRNSMMVKNERMLNKIIGTGTWEVYIDTDRGNEFEIEENFHPLEKKVFTEIAKEAKIKEETAVVSSLNEEVKKAEEIRQEASKVIQNIMTDARLGNAFTIEQAEAVVDKVVTSAIRNNHALVSLARMRRSNQFLFEHSVSTCALMVAFSKSFGYNEEMQHEAGLGALFHDIGMSHIPSQIINKPGKLTRTEYAEIKRHVDYGSNILNRIVDSSSITLLMAMEHHERYNGRGYPNNLRQDNLSKIGQMMAIVDVYDAMTSTRGYRQAATPSEAMVELLNRSDKEFHGELIQRFIQSIGIYPFGTLVKLVNGFVGIVIEVNPAKLLYPVIRVVFENNKRVSAYDIDLFNYETDQNYRIAGIIPPQHKFLRHDEIENILKLEVEQR